MELIYKRLEQNEIPMCADTLIKAFKEEPWNEDWTFEQACTRLDELMSARVSRGYIVFDSEEKIVVGMVIGRVMTYISKKELWLDEVSIHPDYQRKGIGTGMLEYVKRELNEEADEISNIVQLELYARDSIHSRDALLVYIPKEKALFVGDADCEDLYNNAEVKRSRLKDYRHLINQFDFERYFIGHDMPDSKIGVNNYLNELEDKALE